MANWATPGSKQVLPAKAPREAWLAERRKGIGGSEISAILGLTKWGSAYSVWLDKTGKSPGIEETPAMRWGKLHEPAMRQAFTEDTGLTIRQTGLHRSKLNPVFQITPDGLVEDGGVFESKTGSFRVLEDWSDEQISDHAHLQVTWAMGITGRSHAHVVALIDGWNWHIRRVERDQAMVEDLFGFIGDWWDKYVLTDTPPPVTSAALDDIKTHFRVADKPAVAEDPDEIVKLLRRLDEEKKAVKAAEVKQKTTEAEIRLKAGTADVLTDAEEVALLTLRNDGTFSPTHFKTLISEEELAGLTVMAPALDMEAIKTKYAEQYAASRARVLRSKVK